MEDAQRRFIAEARERPCVTDSALVGVETASPKAKEVTLVRKMGPIVDENGKDSGVRTMPFYWHAWNLYRSEHFVTRGKWRGRRFLLPDWAPVRRRGRAQNLGRARPRLLQALVHLWRDGQHPRTQQDVEEEDGIESGRSLQLPQRLTHTTKTGLNALKDRSGSGFQPRYDHYHSELTLLYAAHLAAMHFGVIRDYFGGTEVDVTRWKNDVRPLDVA